MANDIDVAWKDAIHEFTDELIEFFSPELYAQIDRKRQIAFLDKELNELALSIPNEIGAKPENTEVDVLVDLPLLDTIDVWILLHTEVQGAGGKKDINLRMYEYNCALQQKHHKNVIGLLIAIEPLSTESGELGAYVWQKFGTKIVYQYNVIKTYELNEDELLKKGTPFSLLLLAAKRAHKVRKNDHETLTFLKEYRELLLAKNYPPKTSVFLVAFAERITRMKNSTLLTEYIHYVREQKKQIEGEPKMLLTIMDEILLEEQKEEGWRGGKLEGKLEGVREGELKGKLETARRLRERGMNLEQIQAVTDLSDEQMKMI